MKEKIESNKLPHEVLYGQIRAGSIIIDCYHLDNNMRAISKRGMQKALGIPADKSGDMLEKTLLSCENNPLKPANFSLIKEGFTKASGFTRKNAGGAQKKTLAFEATFLIDVCHFIQDLYHAKLLPEEYKIWYINATIIERAFSKLGIIAYIDEATGYIKYKKKNEYSELFSQFLLEEARQWSKVFKDDFFDIVCWGIWLQRDPPKIDKHKRPSCFNYIIKEYIYKPLAVKKFGFEAEAEGILLSELEKKNPVIINGRRKWKLHQFLDEIGIDLLKEHITKVITIAEMSNNKRTFKTNFNRVFKLLSPQTESFKTEDEGRE